LNPRDLLASWSTLSFGEIDARLEAGGDEEAVEQLFGATEVAEMRSTAAVPRAPVRREAVVLLPGMMGSLLSSIRGVTTLLWINPALFLNGQSSYLELNQDGTRDGSPNIESVPVSLEKLVYLKIGLALHRQTDLFEFPYDWRRPIEQSADVLHECIERWADGDLDRRFTLVGHSMGGLVARAYLARHAQVAERRVKHLITHGTPHFGATSTIENLITGNQMMDIVTFLNDQNQPRRFLMNLPSAYQLLPAPPDLFPSETPYPVNWDLYDAAAWGLEDVRQDYLDAGRRFHQLLAGADTQVQITQIAGCNLDTLVEVRREPGTDGEPRFDFIRVGDGSDSGDNTVPLWSAELPKATVHYIQHTHTTLPANRQVIQATLDLVHDGETDRLPTDLPPREPGLFGLGAVSPAGVRAVEAVEVEGLRRRLEEGTANAEDLFLMYFAM
jgi:pimeloyl-ACP methyl ester carboxylesterase